MRRKSLTVLTFEYIAFKNRHRQRRLASPVRCSSPEEPEQRFGSIMNNQMAALSEFSLDSMQVLCTSPLLKLVGRIRWVSSDGEGLVRDSFEFSLQYWISRVNKGRVGLGHTIACAFVLQVLRNSMPGGDLAMERSNGIVSLRAVLIQHYESSSTRPGDGESRSRGRDNEASRIVQSRRHRHSYKSSMVRWRR